MSLKEFGTEKLSTVPVLQECVCYSLRPEIFFAYGDKTRLKKL